MHLKRVFLYCLLWALLPLLVVYLYLTYNVFIADSEMWSVNLGYHFFSELSHPWVFSRIIFYLPLWLVQIFTDQAVVNLYLARTLMLFNSFVLFYFLFQLTKSRPYSQQKSFNWFFIATMVTLLSNTTFLNQGFRIRSDLVATVLALISVCYFQWNEKRTLRNVLFFFFLPLLATPKALIYCIGFLAFKPWMVFWKNERLRYFMLGSISVASFLFVYSNLDSLIFLKRAIFDETNSPIYFSSSAFYHVFKSIRYNPLFYLLLVESFSEKFLSTQEPSKEDLTWQSYDYFCLILFSLFLILPEKVPFLLASLLPFFSILIARKILAWSSEYSIKKGLVSICGMALITWNVSQWSMDNIANNSNEKQLRTIANLQTALEVNGIESYVDGFGMVPAKDKYRIFLGPNNYEASRSVLKLVRGPNPPEILVFTAALRTIAFKMDAFLDRSYLPLERGFFVRAFDFAKMSQDEIKNFLQQNANGPKGLKRILIVELNTLEKGKVQSIRRIKMTIEELMRMSNDTMMERGNRSRKGGNYTEIGLVSVYSDLKVGGGESFEEMFKFDYEF